MNFFQQQFNEVQIKQLQQAAQEKPLLCLMGPTASGKTALAIELSQQLDGEIISVDSALIYQGMDIGTAKPNAEELAAAKHHLIDIRDPAESYSAAEFSKDTCALIADIYERGKHPILAGGTMLYFKTLIQGMAQLPATDVHTRQQVNRVLKEKGSEALHSWLKEFDEETAQRLHPNDPQRLSRAIEVYLMTGKPLSQWHAEQELSLFPLQRLDLAIAPEERSVLHQRIEQRFDIMLQQGFEQEVTELFQRGDLNSQMPSIRSVGYRQMWSYLEDEYDLAEARFRGIVATRQLAKRQFTWLRSWPGVYWLDTFAPDNSQKVLKKLNNISI